jgi:DNA-binding response OmpR family regulator
VNIAILEDNPAILDYLSTALEMSGHHIATFTHGADLLDALFYEDQSLSDLPFDLILVDLLLPGDISGLDAIRSIRGAYTPERLPIIIVSACSQKELDEAQAALPGTPMMRKPFKIQELLHLIDSVKVG